MTSLAPDRLFATPTTGSATRPVHSWRLTADEEAAAVAELTRAAPGWAALLAECAALALGYGEHQFDAGRYRQIAELCVAAGVDRTLIEGWVEVGRRRTDASVANTHNTCVLWDS